MPEDFSNRAVVDRIHNLRNISKKDGDAYPLINRS